MTKINQPVNSLTVLGLLLVLSYILEVNQRAGLAIWGVMLCLTSASTLVKRETIWKGYKKHYKKSKNSARELLNKPREIYYKLNVLVVLPLMFLLGLVSLYAAWKLV